MASKPPDDWSENEATAPDVPDPDTGTPAQPHDAFFRSIFGDPAHAAAVLQSILPPQPPVGSYRSSGSRSLVSLARCLAGH